MSSTPWITAGDAKAAVTGLAGAYFATWIADPDAQLNPSGTPAQIAWAAALNTLGSTVRKKMASSIDALAAAIAGLASVGTGSIIPGANATTILDSAVTTTSRIIPYIIGVPDSTAGEIGAACLTDGVVTITSRHNATLTLNVGYFAVNA